MIIVICEQDITVNTRSRMLHLSVASSDNVTFTSLIVFRFSPCSIITFISVLDMQSKQQTSNARAKIQSQLPV